MAAYQQYAKKSSQHSDSMTARLSLEWIMSQMKPCSKILRKLNALSCQQLGSGKASFKMLLSLRPKGMEEERTQTLTNILLRMILAGL